MKNQELVVHNTESGSGFPLASMIDGEWVMSPYWDEMDFIDWITEQEGANIEIDYTDPLSVSYTTACPACDEPVTLEPKDGDMYEFDCESCGESDEVDMSDLEDDDE